MSDVEANGRLPGLEPARPSTPYHLVDVVPDISNFVWDVLGRKSGSTVASLPPPQGF